MKSRSAVRSIFAKWILFGCFLLVTSVLGQDLYSESELQALSNEELERLCSERGFELVKNDIDPTTGLIYELTHADYVEAAQRCVAIEQEMNQLLDEYPELAEELEEEIKKMEEVNAARQAEVDQLQKELSEAEDATTEKSEPSSGAAFVSKPQPTKDSEDDDLEISDEEPTSVDEAKEQQQRTINEINEEEIATETEMEKEPEPKVEESNNNPGLKSPNATSSKEDLTMKALTVEILRGMVRHAENDLKRIVELMAPVLRPLLQAGEVALRRIRAAIVVIQKNYESSRSKEEAESCADETAA